MKRDVHTVEVLSVVVWEYQDFSPVTTARPNYPSNGHRNTSILEKGDLPTKNITSKERGDTMITNKQTDFMRADIASGYMYTKFIDAVRRKLAKEGKDFDEELKRWKERKAIENCHLGYGDEEVI